MTIRIPVVKLNPDVPLPSYAHLLDAGADIAISHDQELGPGERALVGTGIAMAIPDGYVGLMHPRSGLAARHGLTIVNAPGTIDAGYRGEIRVNLLNTDRSTAIQLRRGDLIAQLVIQEVIRATFEPADSLPNSERGAAGHGSSGGVAAWTSVEPTITDQRSR